MRCRNWNRNIGLNLCKIKAHGGGEEYGSSCVIKIGSELKDTSVCEIFINDLNRGKPNPYVVSCYESLAWRLCDSSICNKIESNLLNAEYDDFEDIRASCFSRVDAICQE